MNTRLLVFFFSISIAASLLPSSKANGDDSSKLSSSPFSASIDTLQKQIGYGFQRVSYLRRAMTHPSFSRENNRALSILGLKVIETSISFRCLKRNIEISPKDLSLQISDISSVDSCADDGSLLGLEKIVRVSSKMNSSTPSIVCSAFRAIFGAIAVDTNNPDYAGNVFWNVTHHGGGGGGRAFAM